MGFSKENFINFFLIENLELFTFCFIYVFKKDFSFADP